MPQLLFLSLRDGEIGPAVARAEYHDVLQSAGLEEVEVVHRIIDGPGAEIGPLDGVAGVIVGGSSLNVTAEGGYSAYQQHVHALLADLGGAGELSEAYAAIFFGAIRSSSEYVADAEDAEQASAEVLASITGILAGMRLLPSLTDPEL